MCLLCYSEIFTHTQMSRFDEKALLDKGDPKKLYDEWFKLASGSYGTVWKVEYNFLLIYFLLYSLFLLIDNYAEYG